jgi:hypothetical protein
MWVWRRLRSATLCRASLRCGGARGAVCAGRKLARSSQNERTEFKESCLAGLLPTDDRSLSGLPRSRNEGMHRSVWSGRFRWGRLKEAALFAGAGEADAEVTLTVGNRTVEVKSSDYGVFKIGALHSPYNSELSLSVAKAGYKSFEKVVPCQ